MRPIKYCLNKQLVNLCQRSFQLEDLQEKISQLLPQELAHTCQVSSFDKGCLILTTRDASWASLLRYAMYDLRDKLRKEAGLYQLLSIKVNLIEPLQEYVNKPQAQLNQIISTKAKAQIIENSKQCTYLPLKQALLHLAGETPPQLKKS
ncbi:MAG: DUF721 domain-containing protein [Legionella sp.]|nr:DUF721 domain-containing protein [Legionella sp.]